MAAYSRAGEHAACWLALGLAGAALSRRPDRRRAWLRGVGIGRRLLRHQPGDQVRRPSPPARARRAAAAHTGGHPPVVPERPRHHLVRRRPRLRGSRAGLGPVRRGGGVRGLPALSRRALPERRRRRRAARNRAIGGGSWREGRDRRHAQRGQVLAVQRADRRGRRGGQLPVHDDRAQRGDRPGHRRAPRRGRRGRSKASQGGARTRSPSTTSPAWSPARTAARVSATSSWPTSARPTRSSTSSGCTRTRTWSTRGPGRSAGRHRDDRDRADLRRPRAGRAPARPGGAHGQERRPPRRRGGRVAARS